MTLRIVGTALLAAVACGGCSLPLASRRAQVLEPGELELSGGTAGGVLYSEAVSLSSPYLPALGTNASIRVGIIPRVDLQLRLLDLLLPEISAGWQLVGDPALNELALTLTAGAGPVLSAGFSTAGDTFSKFGAFIPAQLLVDVPIGDGALTFGGRVIGTGSRIDASGTESYAFTLTPGLMASWTLPLGAGFFARPEIAASVPLFVAAPLGEGSFVMGALAFGYESRL